MRICGDLNLRVSLNPVLTTEIPPFPLPEELFNKFYQGCWFSKIDLADSYLQIELDAAPALFEGIVEGVIQIFMALLITLMYCQDREIL